MFQVDPVPASWRQSKEARLSEYIASQPGVDLCGSLSNKTYQNPIFFIHFSDPKKYK